MYPSAFDSVALPSRFAPHSEHSFPALHGIVCSFEAFDVCDSDYSSQNHVLYCLRSDQIRNH
jgi:hypothetical protein